MKTSIQKNTLATICIPATRVNTSLKNCLLSLQNQKNRHFQIVIVTREKKLNEKRLEEQYALPITTVVQKKSGLVEAVNTAFRVTKTPIFIRIDDDVVVEPQWFDELIKPFKKKTVGGVTGPTLIDESRLKERDIFLFFKQIEKNPLLKKLIIEYLYEDKVFEVSTFLRSGVFTLGSNMKNAIPNKQLIVNNVEACNFAIRSNLLRTFGGFDDIFTKGLGDYHEADIAMKIQKAGYNIVFHPKAITHHAITRGDDAIRGDAYYRIQNFIHFYKRHFKINSLDILMRFSTNLLVQNCYYVYTGMKRRDISQFGSLPGTLKGLLSTKIV